MKDNSTDQLLLLAQMMAEEDSPSMKSSLNSNIPLILIVFVGAFVVLIAVLATQQWSQHVERTLTDKVERIYSSQIQSHLSAIKQNANSVAGFIRASEFISEQEFETFSDSLQTRTSSSKFVYMEQNREAEHRYLVTSNDVSVDAIKSMLGDERLKRDFATLGVNLEGKYLTAESQEGEFVVYYLPVNASAQKVDDFVLYGIRVSHLINSQDLGEQFAEIRLFDNVSSDLVVNLNGAKSNDRTNTIDIEVDNLEIFLKFGISTYDLIRYNYFKWFLIGFSLIFTVLLCGQIVAAKRSIRKLAGLAVQRANDLSSINTELADEIMNRIRFQAELLEKTQEIEETNRKLEEAKSQLFQQEKLASLGQMAAGVAHEINNPVGFINSNLSMMKRYSKRALSLCALLEDIAATTLDDALRDYIRAQLSELKFNTLRNNMIPVIDESMEGIDRVKKIVQDLKDFSRVDEAEWQMADIHAGIESTLNIAWNEIKYKAEVHKDFGELPKVECVPSQINQVIMNLLVNSAQAMSHPGNIYIRTRAEDDHVIIEVQDDGCGIPDDIIGKIFDPFFTTKEVGKGTGLGLSLSYGIITKHQGELTVTSIPGESTTFVIKIPVSQRESDHEEFACA